QGFAGNERERTAVVRAGGDKELSGHGHTSGCGDGWARTVCPTRGVASTAAVRGGLVDAGDGGGDAAARGEGRDELAAERAAGGHEVVEQAVDEVLVEDALVAEALQVELERLQLDAAVRRRVGVGDGAEVRLAGLGANAGELGTDDFDGVV